mmetsp:Transcript_34083/g.63616  ORF Transcript_34083/g.63616 Transcript_34083/m.63616 type:complete len:512 (+) Transcript_34083:101-1636(+)
MLMLQATLLLGLLLIHCSSHVASDCTSADGTCSNALEFDAAHSSKALLQAKTSRKEGPELSTEDVKSAFEAAAAENGTAADAPPAVLETDANQAEEQDPAAAAAAAAAAVPAAPPVDPAAQAAAVTPAPPVVPAPAPVPPPAPLPKVVLWSPTIDQAGYVWVKQSDCHFEKEQFVRRVANALNFHICDERGMQALIVKHFQASANLDYTAFSTDVIAGKDGQCPWIIANGQRCPETAPAECPPVRWTPDEYLGGWKNDPVHRRRICRNKNPGLAKITNVATDFVPPAPVPPLADAPPGTLPTALQQQAAVSQSKEQQNSLLQAEGAVNQSTVGTPGTSAPLNEQGLSEVKRTASPLEMEYFVIRVIAKNNLHICNQGGLQGLLTAYKQAGDIAPTSTLTYDRIEHDITAAVSQECSWLGTGPENKKNSCPENCVPGQKDEAGNSTAKTGSSTVKAPATIKTTSGNSSMKTPLVKQEWQTTQKVAANLTEKKAALLNEQGSKPDCDDAMHSD